MAKIKHDDLITKDVLQPTITQANELIDALNAVEDQIIDLVKTSSDVSKLTKSFGDSKNIDKLNQATKDIAESETMLLQVRQEKAKLEVEIKKADAEGIKNKGLQLKLDIQGRKEQERLEKQRKKELKQGKDLDSAYKKQSKRLNDLRKKYKDARIANGKATKETSEWLKEIKKLDQELKDVDAEVGQFQRSVGDYSKQALGSAKSTLALAGAMVGLSGSLDDVKGGFSANEEGSKELSNLTSQASAVFNTFANRTGKAATGLLSFAKNVASGDKSIFDFSTTLNTITNAYEGVIAASGKAADAAGIASDEAFELDRSSLALREQLVLLNGEYERQSAIAGDGTLTFIEQQKAIEEATDINIRRIAIQRNLADQELQIIQDRVKATEDDANRFALEQEASEKRIELQEIENELSIATLDNKKVLREIQRDDFERQLDFAIDAFDAQKTINERQISDDRKSLEERSSILAETTRLADSSFQSQKELFAEFVDDRVNFDELVKETDESAIRRTLFKLNLDDIELGRALEVIKERKIALQDLDDADREVSEAIQERVETRLGAIDEADNVLRERQIDRLNEEIANDETTNARKIELINQRTAIQEEVLRNESNTLLRNDELTAEERVVIEEQLINDIANLEQEKVDAVKDANQAIIDSDKETLLKRIEGINEIKNAFKDAIAEEFEEKQSEIDSEIEKRKESISFTRKLAIEGNADAAKQLQFESDQLAKAEQKKAQLAKQEAQAKRAIAIVDSYFAAFERRLDDPDTKPGGAALAALGDVSKGVATSEIARALVGASFAYDGTENVSKDGAIYDRGSQKDNLLYWLHPNERVMTDKQNAKVGNMSNDELANLAYNHQNGGSYLSSLNGMTDNVRLEMKMAMMLNGINNNADTIANAINDKPVQQVNVDSFGNLVEVVYRNGVKDTVKHQAKKWL